MIWKPGCPSVAREPRGYQGLHHLETQLVTQRKSKRVRETRRLPDADLLYTSDVAGYLGVTPAAVRKRVRRRQLGPWMRLGNRYAIRRSSFERWLDRQERKGVV